VGERVEALQQAGGRLKRLLDERRVASEFGKLSDDWVATGRCLGALCRGRSRASATIGLRGMSGHEVSS